MTTTPPQPELTGDADPGISGQDRATYYRILGLVGIGFLVQTLATDSGFCALPLRLLLKNDLHQSANAIATFGAIANVAWYCKPLAGVLADSVPIGGTRYRNYLLMGAAGAALGWGVMGIVPRQVAPLLVTFILVNVLLMLISTVLGGFMVTEGRVFKATGRLGSFRNSAMTAASLIAGPVGGYLAGKEFGWTAGISAGMLAMFFVYVLFSLKEAPIPPRSANSTPPFKQFLMDLGSLAKAKTFWAAVAMTFFVTVMPGFGTVLLFHQQDDLKFSAQLIGNLGFIASAMGLIGGAIYILLCRHIPLRRMLAISILLSTLSAGLYELYNSAHAAILIDGTNGLLGAMASVALFDLAARAAPRRTASLSYSLLMATYNIGSQLSNVGGSWLHDHYHLSIYTLIWISTGTTLLTIFAVPFLPKALVDSADGEPGDAVPEAGQ